MTGGEGLAEKNVQDSRHCVKSNKELLVCFQSYHDRGRSVTIHFHFQCNVHFSFLLRAFAYNSKLT